MLDDKEFFKPVLETAVKAGKEILKIYQKDSYEVTYKDDQSPLTEADRKSHSVITENLSQLNFEHFPLPVFSEESKAIPYEERQKFKRFFLVDPLDGTKEFINQNGEFTVNIALIDHGVPVFGVVYVPVPDVLYFGSEKTGAYRMTGFDRSCFDCLDKYRIQTASYNEGEPLNIVASRSHLNEETSFFIKEIEKKYTNVNFKSAGSSLKICLVASGDAHLYPRFAPTSEWDTAAAHAVLNAAGGVMIDIQKKTDLVYNKKNILNPHFLAASDKCFI